MLHHVQILIPVGGEGEARSFYRDVLRMSEVDKPPVLAARGGCWFRGTDWEVHLAPVEDFVPAKRAHPGILVEDIDETAEKLKTAGSPVKWDPHFPGHRRFYTEDRHGNRLEFLEAIKD